MTGARVAALRGAALAVSLLVLAAGCGRDQAEAPAGGTVAPGAPAALEVTDVELGTAVGSDRRITQATDRFRSTDTIYVSVLTSGGSGASSQLTARFTYEDGQLVDESSQTITPSGSDATEFHVSKPDGWPAGEYEVEILLDGRSVEREEFEVE
jgi:uncharacterized protein YfaS (alpha-2-macroglobulin family)